MTNGNQGLAVRNLDTLLEVGAVGGLTDAQLLRLFTFRRDEAAELAFAVLIDRHGPMVLRVCHAVLGNSHDAHDSFQATFLVLVQKARALWVHESLGPWLHQVAHRTACHARSARARRRRYERLAASFSPQLASGEVLDDLGEVLHEELGRLPERYRAAVVLCLLEGLTPDQAAHHLGWPVGTVRSRLARGRERLRGRLTRRGLAPGVEGIGWLPAVKPITVPTTLVAATKRAVMQFAAGNMGNGVVTASVVGLATEETRTKMITKLMMAGGTSLALGVMAAAGALPLFQAGETPKGTGKPDTIQAQPPPPTKIDREQSQPVGRAFSLAISSDGKTLAAGCSDGSLHVLDARTGEKRLALAGVTRGYVRGVGFTPDGKTIAGLCDDDRLRLWEATSGRLLKELPALGDLDRAGLPQLSPTSLAISPDGSLIAVGGRGSTDRAETRLGDETTFFEVRVLDIKSGQLDWSHLGRRGFLEELAFSPDGKLLASATSLEVRLWDARAGDMKQTLKPRSGSVWTVAFSPDNRLMAGYGNATVEGKSACWLTLWDIGSGAIVHSIDANQESAVTAAGTLAFSPDGKSLASAGIGSKEGRISIGGRAIRRGWKVINHIKLWNVSTGALVWTSAEGDLGHVTSLVFSPDGESLVCCDSSAITRIDARTGQTRQDLMRAPEGQPR